MTTGNGAIQSLDPAGVVSYYTSPQNTTTKDFALTDANPFSHKVLESSPLDRIQQQVQVGNAWSSKPVTFGYDANKSTDKVMRFWSNVYWPNQNNNDLKLEASKYFGDNQLYKNTVTDEDGNKTIEFKNGEGQTLLVRKEISANKFADTYYVYNEYNKLSFVISPEASKKLDAALSGGASALDPATRDIIDNLCYQYKYDGRSRLIEKKIPGKGWEYMVYDKQDRLIFTQDANLASGTASNPFGSPGWLFTKYDQFGRVVYTGFVASNDGRAAVQSVVDSSTTIISNNESRSTTPLNYNGTNVYYTNNAFPSVITKLLSVNYYDTYPPDLASVPGSIQSQAVLPQTGNQSTQSLPTASFVKNVEDDKWTKTYTFYDQKGRPIGTWSYNHLGGYTKSESVIDFAGVPQKTMTYHKRKTTGAEVVVKEDFVYDNQNRLLEHYHEVVGKTPVVSLSKNTYNEIGQLVRKEVGRSAVTPLQTVDYTYNIRGWMTGINSGDIAYNATDGSYVLNNGKLFGYNIRYDNPQTSYLGTPRYNGNISEVDWISRDVSLKRYGYKYDGLNRLLRGNYQDPGTALPESRINDEDISYDLNGNIIHLLRNAKHAKNYTPVLIDDLSYNYTGNRVTSITDATGNSSGYEGGGQTLTYDANGNTTAMPDKKISAIAYNYLNLPKQINQNANVTNYYYRADGVKLKKKFVLTNSAGTKVINTEYLDGFQYSTPNTEPIRKVLENPDEMTMEVASAGEQEAFLPDASRKVVPSDPQQDVDNMALSFFPTAEGYYDYENLRYIYQYKDHLGNVRVSYVKNGNDLEIRDRNDYYPFGMSFLKSNQATLYDPMAIPYNYKYNGKELQETGFYDYGARMYMPDIARWGVVDPLAEKSRRFSPYTYALDNPILFVDPDGREAYKPTPREAALMSKHVYGDNVKLEGGWKVSNAGKGLPLNNKSGLKSAVYERTVDGKTEYTYATAGTENGKDWKNNATQLVGASEQYKESKSNAEALKARLGDAELTFTGHSLGGGLAEGNAIATGDNAITFNAAGVTAFTSGSDSKSNTEAYIMTTDPLNALQQVGSAGSKGLIPTAGGEKHWLQPRNPSGIYNGHSINSVIDALSQPTVLQKIWNTVKQAITPPNF
ncbi:MAG: sugar-binding protein [Chryseobacterium sp.]|nr:MAG: sugar-binding protein [Chryseobacterium sp.]